MRAMAAKVPDAYDDSTAAPRARWPRRILTALTILVVASCALSIAVYLSYFSRDPAPTERQQALGAEYLRLAGELPWSFDPAAASEQQLKDYVAQHAPQLAALKRWIATPDACIPLKWDAADIERAAKGRAAARLLLAEAQIARAEGRYSDAATIATQIIELGKKLADRGLLVHWLIGTAVEGIGLDELSKSAPGLSTGECARLISDLTELEDGRESLETVRRRDERWSAHEGGWRWAVASLTARLKGLNQNSALNAQVSRIARFRMAQSILAIEAFRREHGRWPAELGEIVPRYLPQAPLDPWSDKPLVYRVQADSYCLYSVGTDRVDNGGQVPADIVLPIAPESPAPQANDNPTSP